MMQQEFTQRTGFVPTQQEWVFIEEAYMASDDDKDKFCRAWKRLNAGRVAKQKEEVRAQRAYQAGKYELVRGMQYCLEYYGKGGSTIIPFWRVRESIVNDDEFIAFCKAALALKQGKWAEWRGRNCCVSAYKPIRYGRKD